MARILLIEDNDPVRALLRENLELEGYTVIEARDGQEGLDLFRQAGADLVITDIVMPEKEGLAVLWPVDKCGPPTTLSYNACRSRGPTRRSEKSGKNSVAQSRQGSRFGLAVLSARTRPRARISALRHCGQMRSHVSFGGGELELGMAHRHVVVSMGEELPQCL